MKILALADVHGNMNASYKAREWIEAHDVELVVIAGDITHFGPAEWAEEFVRSIAGFGVKVLGVPGNCDPPEVSDAIEKGGGISLHERRIDLEGISFAGVGGSNPTPFPTLYERQDKELAGAVEHLMNDLDVFVSHAPPKGRNDKAMFGGHVGSRELSDIIGRWPPRMVITGHIHEARGILQEERTVFMNPGKAGSGKAGLVEICRGEERPRAVLL